MYKRVLLKLSGEALSSAEYAFDPMLLSRLADELKEVHHLGIDLAIVGTKSSWSAAAISSAAR